MTWIASLAFAAVSLAAAWVGWTLSANLEPQPEYPTVMTDTIRLIGLLIAVCGAVLGVILLGNAVVEYVGWYTTS